MNNAMIPMFIYKSTNKLSGYIFASIHIQMYSYPLSFDYIIWLVYHCMCKNKKHSLTMHIQSEKENLHAFTWSSIQMKYNSIYKYFFLTIKRYFFYHSDCLLQFYLTAQGPIEYPFWNNLGCPGFVSQLHHCYVNLRKLYFEILFSFHS